MSKKSFKDIEQFIKTAAEANEPAFDEQAWQKMEVMLDKDKDRRRPVVFWVWWLLPLLIGAAVGSYFIFNGNVKKEESQKIATQKNNNPSGENANDNTVSLPDTKIESFSNNEKVDEDIAAKNVNTNKNCNGSLYVRVTDNNKKNKPVYTTTNVLDDEEKINAKKNLNDRINGKMAATIKPATAASDDESNETGLIENNSTTVKSLGTGAEKKEEVIVIKVDADKTSEKEIEKMIDSVVTKINNDKKKKRKIAGLYIIAAAGAEASGVKLFSADKVTGRYGLGLGYQLNKNLSVQTGFYVSNKKYGAAGSDYKTKAGSYWSTVDIKSIDANCKVYEIPISVIYNFTPGKKLNIFASAGLSSYIMKRENYRLYYNHYGVPTQADVNYKGNKNLFSVLRLSAGVEKKISNRFSVIASPGIAIPLSGVGDGEVKLYSADITIGLKFTPFQKK